MDNQVFKSAIVKKVPRNPYAPPQSLKSPKTWLLSAVTMIKKCNKHCQFAQGLRTKSQEYRRVRCAEVDSWNKAVLVELLQQCIAELRGAAAVRQSCSELICELQRCFRATAALNGVATVHQRINAPLACTHGAPFRHSGL